MAAPGIDDHFKTGAHVDGPGRELAGAIDPGIPLLDGRKVADIAKAIGERAINDDGLLKARNGGSYWVKTILIRRYS